MCFSATASFIAGSVLTGAGITAMVRTRKSSDLFFSAIPLLFAVQQFAEGMLWLVLDKNLYTEYGQLSLFVFLLFAQVIWPVWVPYAVYKTEAGAKRKKWLLAFVAVGLAFAAYATWCLVMFPFSARVMNHHILYTLQFRNFPWTYISTGFYLAATMVPLFISGIRRIRLLGYTIFASFILSVIIYPEHVISTWCYFAAILSFQILYATEPAYAQRMSLSGSRIS
jgi:hypothetical protein